MGKLFDNIRAAVAAERLVVTTHADDSLRDRGIEVWQLLAEVDAGRLLSERPRDVPNPSIEVDQTIPDGTPVKVV